MKDWKRIKAWCDERGEFIFSRAARHAMAIYYDALTIDRAPVDDPVFVDALWDYAQGWAHVGGDANRRKEVCQFVVDMVLERRRKGRRASEPNC